MISPKLYLSRSSGRAVSFDGSSGFSPLRYRFAALPHIDDRYLGCVLYYTMVGLVFKVFG